MIPTSNPELAAFADRIDLWDETLREGAERSPLSPSIEEKVGLAHALTEAGLRSIVVGMFPDVPHNVELLRALIVAQDEGRIAPEVKFIVISHLGTTLSESLEKLSLMPRVSSVWVLGIFGTSDLHVEHLYPVIRQKDSASRFDAGKWQRLSLKDRRAESEDWFEAEAERLQAFGGGGVAVGLLDAFRTNAGQLAAVAARAIGVGVTDIRLVDTAGTCVPQQIETHVRPLIAAYPEVRFYGHFHNDFGLATGNAVLGLSNGLAGADVSVGGFANRAGHPALAEVVMALKLLYMVELPGFEYDRLFALSRTTEQIYGLMESPTQPITGVITHGVLSGIRTQLIAKAPTIFDLVDPTEVGAKRDRVFGVRSGVDGMRRFLAEHADELDEDQAGLAERAEGVFEFVSSEWQARSKSAGRELTEAISRYYIVLKGSAAFTEAEMLKMIQTQMAGAR